MNILSLISFFNGYSFIILGLYILRLNKKEILNKLAAAVNLCFAVWSISYTFFYTAPTVDSALLVHKISSFGWIMFCPFAAHFFLILSEKTKNWKGIKFYVFIYALPAVLFFKTLISNESPVARSFVQSKIGWGWTYISNVGSIWYWIYSLHIVIYFSVVLYFTYKWAKRTGRLRFLKQAKGIIILDSIMIALGCFTDLALPAFSTMIPPIFNLLSIFWGIGFFHIIKIYKLITIYDAASPDLILKTVIDPILLLDSNGLIITCNQAAADLFKCDLKQVINKPLSYFFKSKKYNDENLKILFSEKVLSNVEIDLVDSEGNTINSTASFSLAENKLDGLVGTVVSIHDITRLKKIEEELYKSRENYREISEHLDMLANYDKLSGLPNRRLLLNKLDSALENYRMSGNGFALAFIDLDGFKTINDTYGHDIGDLLLINISDLLLSSIRKQDNIARVGGDEFVIIFNDLENQGELNNVIQRISDIFSKPIIIKSISCNIGISLGISKCPEDGITSDQLMKAADERMYKNKSSKRIR